MPNRIIREGFLDSEAINSLSSDAENFFVRLMLKADDFGRYTAHTTLLKSSLFPLKVDKIKESEISKWLLECQRTKPPLLITYEADGKKFLWIPKFQQRTRAEKSKYPDPPTFDGQLTDTCQTSAHGDGDGDGDVFVFEDEGGKSVSANESRQQPEAQSDDEWLESLAKNPAYEGIDIKREFGKMTAWCSARRKQPTRRRFINWINNCDRPFRPATNGTTQLRGKIAV